MGINFDTDIKLEKLQIVLTIKNILEILRMNLTGLIQSTHAWGFWGFCDGMWICNHCNTTIYEI